MSPIWYCSSRSATSWSASAMSSFLWWGTTISWMAMVTPLCVAKRKPTSLMRSTTSAVASLPSSR